ncbi:MAG TPA: RraA family protein [Desulfomonilia bacterium]|jgi:4-hydroxy-4-methyl-2-oxoglutarate aldolase
MPKTYEYDEILSFCERIEKTYTPAIADSLDEMGFMNQSMNVGFAPILPKASVAGPAFTMEEAKTRKSKRLMDYDPEFVAEMLESVFGSMKKGQIVVINTNGFYGAGGFGELMAHTCKFFGGVKGAVVDGPIRDINRVLEIDFPVWAKGSIPTDSIGRVDLVGIGSPIFCGGIKVNPSDIIFADRDGIVVIPVADVDLAEVVEMAEDRFVAERRSRQELREGKSLLEVYRKYGKL